MGALSPLFLLAGLAVGVPIYLHLFQRHQTRRLSFPALRYLERTEREHARQIRFRQLLLLLARVAVLLLIVGAGARLFFSGRGGAHAPTAAVIVLDNSRSSGLVVGEVRVLDELKAMAERTLDAASDEDRFWVIRAGEPWTPAIPGAATEARRAVEETEASEAAGDLTAALDRAVRLLSTSGMDNREIHLLSDLQQTAFELPGASPAGELPVVVWTGHTPTDPNRALTSVVIGGGLPPLEGQRASVTVAALEPTSAADTAHVPVRLVVNERIRGAATLPPGAQTTIAMPPTGTGWIQGYADADPDALRADDRRFFAYRSRPAPTVAINGTPGVFVSEALAVLEGAGRVRTAPTARADLLVAANGSGLDQRAGAGAVVIVPPADPSLLPALNRRLADAGIPWRFEATTTSGTTALTGRALPEPLQDVQANAWFALSLAGDPPGPTRTLAEVEGQPWAVEGTDAGGRRYLVLASALDASSTDLPVSTGMLRFVDWITSEWAGAGGDLTEHATGSTLPAPAGATHVRFPSGAESEIDGTRMVRGTGQAGFYTFLAADTVVSVLALNPPRAESALDPLESGALQSAVGASVIDVDREAAWDRAVFRARQGPELWWPLLLAVLLLLVAEGLMATSGTVSPFGFRTEAESGGADGGD
jgi:hypothetical protein